MSTTDWYEVIGHIGSVLVVISLLMQSLRKLRIINLVGAVFFALYGLLIDSSPIFVVNAVIILIDIWWLWRMSQEREYFSVLETDPSDKYLAHFLVFHAEDINTYQPEFVAPSGDTKSFFILRNMVPAGLWIGHEVTDGVMQIDLDYVIPRYRDSKAGKFFYGSDNPVAAQQLLAPPPASGHAPYLQRMGFNERADGWFVRPASK
jgi:hypothetical protein